MLTYFLPDFNNYKLRTKQIPSGSNFLRVDVQNMLTNTDFSFLFNPGQWSYNECESIVDISFNLDIPLNVNPGDQYRMFLTPAISSSTTPFTYSEPVWHGSLQVFHSQSVDKPAYVNQIPDSETFISRESGNGFVYWDQAAPIPPIPPTTTAAPTTTTTLAPTTTTTTLAPTTTTTTTAGGIDAEFFFGNQIGGMGFDVCLSGSTNGNIDSVAVSDYKLFMSSDSGCTTPYGTSWDIQSPPWIFNFAGGITRPTTSGGDLSSGNYYRTRVSGSLNFQIPPFQLSPAFTFDISGSGFQDVTWNGFTLRIHGAGCTLNNNSGC
jgi:hypothetical protein